MCGVGIGEDALKKGQELGPKGCGAKNRPVRGQNLPGSKAGKESTGVGAIAGAGGEAQWGAEADREPIPGCILILIAALCSPACWLTPVSHALLWKSCHSRLRWVTLDFRTPSGAPDAAHNLHTPSFLVPPASGGVCLLLEPSPGDCLLLTWTPLSPHSTGDHCWLMRGLGEPFLHISPQSRTEAREAVTERVSSCHARQCMLCLEQGFSTFALLTLWASKVFGVGTVLGHARCLEAHLTSTRSIPTTYSFRL